MRSLHIFRQDLRVQDNTSLLETAKQSKELLPVFIFDRLVLDHFPDRDARLGFLVRTLQSLRKQLQEIWSDLYVFYGKSTEIVAHLLKTYEFDHVSWNRSYGRNSRERDNQIKWSCNTLGVSYQEHDDYLLAEPYDIKPMKVFSPYYRRWLRHPKRWDLLEAKELPWLPHIITQLSQESARIDLNNDQSDILNRIWWTDTPYRTVDLQPTRLRNIDMSNYPTDRNRPDLEGTSRMSPYIRHGLLSPRQILQEVVDTNLPWVTIEGWMITMNDKIFTNTYVSELAWREFRQQTAEHFPYSRNDAFLEKYQNLKRVNNKDWFKRWQDGTTGYPIVDAWMRELKATWWMHGRTRMIVASFLTKDLLIDRRRWRDHFKNYLLDHDENVNNWNWQWSASVGADPKPLRIFNPILQSQKYDPKGDYIRRRVPELANRHDKAIHDPIKYTLNEYYEPVVDHYVTSKYAKEIYYKNDELSEGLKKLYM